MTYDTDTKEVKVLKDGAELPDFHSLEVYPSYDGDKRYSISLREIEVVDNSQTKTRQVINTDTYASFGKALTQYFPGK